MAARRLRGFFNGLLGGDQVTNTPEDICRQAGAQWERFDATERFVQEYVFPAISAQAVYVGTHPICASLSRPLLAQIAVEKANELGCDVIVHTSNPSQNSLRRFNGAFRDLGFGGEFGSPFAHEHISREEKCRVLVAGGFSTFAEKAVSTDTNLWGREFEFGALDDPEMVTVPHDLYLWTNDARRRSGVEQLRLQFTGGVPTHLNGASMDGICLIRQLNEFAGSYGLGRYVGLEEIEGGAKVQEVREMPGASVLLDAYRRIEAACIPFECIRTKMHVEQTWTKEAVEGRWFGDLRLASHAFIQSVASRVDGEVEYLVSQTGLSLRGVRATNPLYVRDRRLLE